MWDQPFWVWLAFKLPRTLAKWCAVRVMTYHYDGNLSTRACLDALQEWSQPVVRKRKI